MQQNASEQQPKTTTTERQPLQPIATTRADQAIEASPVRIGGGDLLDPDEVTPEALEALGRRAEFFEKAVRMALAWTEPDQYVIHKSEDGKTSTVYPMGRAAQALLKFFGMKFAAPIPIVNDAGHIIGHQPGPQECLAETRETKREDGRATRYVCVTSALWMSSGRCVALTEGKRAIGPGYSKDEIQARQCAVQNMASRAARLVLGLGVSPDWFIARGVDLGKAKVVEYQDHKGATSSDPQQAKLPFGNEKGKAVSEASDDALRWILPKVQESVNDPARSRFQAQNKALAAAIEAELARRAAAPALSAEQAEEMERTIIAFREEAAALGVDAKKVDKYVSEIKTLEQAKTALETYRKRREKAEKK
jgi:hypothetical protein